LYGVIDGLLESTSDGNTDGKYEVMIDEFWEGALEGNTVVMMDGRKEG